MADGVVEETVLEALEFTLTDSESLRLAMVGIELERVFGSGRDIEWAFVQGKLYLLQSRPITTLRSWTDWELSHEFDEAALSNELVYTVGNTGEVFPGATSALTISTVIKGLDKAYQKTKDPHLTVDSHVNQCMSVFQNHVFINVLNVIILLIFCVYVCKLKFGFF